MNVLGWLLLFCGILAVRQTAVGRASNIGEDAEDVFTSLVRADWAGITEVSERRGETVNPFDDSSTLGRDALLGAADGLSTVTPGALDVAVGGSLVSEMKRLAAGANNRYVWGATGPNGYDCSGIVWRAMRNLGIYKGGRFTTSTWPGIATAFARRVDSPSGGDVVVWPGQHMGVYVSNGQMYAAKSKNSGIGMQSVSSARSSRPQYWRLGSQGSRGPATGQGPV